MKALVTLRRQAHAVPLMCAVVALCAGCAAAPEAPATVGENYPGTCLPNELSWPSDFLDSLPGERTGPIVGLRLDYLDSDWPWRVRSVTDERKPGEVDEYPREGMEFLLDVRTLAVLSSHAVELTTAERQKDGSSAGEVADRSGEEYPSPLIIDMTRVIDDGDAAWQMTTCNTETNRREVVTLS